MHELAIAESIVDAVAARTGERSVVAVRLRVGRLSGVVTDALIFAFDLATAGTGLQGARLSIEEPAGRLRCRSCEQICDRDDLLLLCDCGSADVEVVSGRELTVVSVEVA